MAKKILKNMAIHKFMDELASDSPAPGGGSVACVNGAMGAALAGMVARLTIGKEKYSSVNELFESKLEILDELHSQLTNLIDEDANAFNGVIAAFKMPKKTDEQKKARSKKIQAEYKKAALVPMKTVRTCHSVLKIIFELGLKGNINAASDIAVGALNAYTGIKAAAMNVQINLPSIKDEDFVLSMNNELEKIFSGLDAKIKDLLEKAKSKF
jgi:formiminotetrahydrofolate cyclodeaminase